jgi:hypothetical protein
MKNALLWGVLLGLLAIGPARSQDAARIEPTVKEKFHLFLLAGQSNMAGRGDVEAEDKVAHARVLVLAQDGTWKPTVDPLHYDKPNAGVGPGKSFASVIADADTNVTIGLIPAACGGSPISSWKPGAYYDGTKSHPYDDAIQRARQAMKQGTLEGILWHQGESDWTAELAPVYQGKLEALIVRFRTDLGDSNLPVMIGQLGQFKEVEWTQYTHMVNDAQVAVAKKVARVAFVSSDELTCRSDHIHFDARSQREFGKRYAAAYLKLVGATQSAGP